MGSDGQACVAFKIPSELKGGSYRELVMGIVRDFFQTTDPRNNQIMWARSLTRIEWNQKCELSPFFLHGVESLVRGVSMCLVTEDPPTELVGYPRGIRFYGNHTQVDLLKTTFHDFLTCKGNTP